MKKKRWAVFLAIVLAFAIPLTVFAANSNSPIANGIKGFLGIDASKLTPQQKADILDFNKKIAEVEKEFINKLVSDKLITQTQADSILKNIDNKLTKANENTVPFFFGKGERGFDKGYFGLGKIDMSKLTEQQKADIMAIYKEMTAVQKDLINKLISEGLLTQDEANKAISRIDNTIANIEKNGFADFRGFIEGKDGLGFILRGIDTSKLTEQQKTELMNYFNQMTQLQKQFVDKIVNFGLITQDQGNAIKNRIDSMQKNIEQNGLPKGFFKHFNRTTQQNSAPRSYNNSI